MAPSSFASQFRFLLLANLLFLCFSTPQAHAGDPDALWKIINGQCVPHQRESGDPTPCAQLDPRPEASFAVLKDRVGIAQFLLIPTKRLTGVESPELLEDNAPNYWASAWQVKTSVEDRLHRHLTRDQVALAINSAFGRSQNQLHIHIDCIRPDIRETLHLHTSEISIQWAPLGVALNGHPYWAKRIPGSELGDNNPFKLLAEGIPSARQHMDRQTLVLTGATFEDGTEGFVLLADHADLVIADRASGEELQDHDCAIAAR
jgi:CDP-diacylglycerol pyrophosphatase